MSDIDPEKLERAIEHLRSAYWNFDRSEPTSVMTRAVDDVIAAARVTLNSLPRYKEVEVSTWALVDSKGAFIFHSFPGEDEAGLWAKRDWHDVAYPVRLTGTAKVKVTS